MIPRLLTKLRWVGHRTQDSMESQDGTVEGLMYAHSEDNNHEEASQRLQQRQQHLSPETPLHRPWQSPSDAHLSPTISPISPSFSGTNERERVRRWLHLQRRRAHGRVPRMTIGIRDSRWRLRCPCLPILGSPSTLACLGLRRPHQYRNRGRVLIQIAGSELIRRARTKCVGPMSTLLPAENAPLSAGNSAKILKCEKCSAL